MSNISKFFKKKLEKEITEYIASERFVDDKGEYIPFKLEKLTNKEFDKIRDKYMINSMKNGQKTVEFDNNGFTQELVTRVIVEPNLQDAELQEFYGAFGEYDLLLEMLEVGEKMALEQKIMSLHTFNEEFKKVVEEIKKQ